MPVQEHPDLSTHDLPRAQEKAKLSQDINAGNVVPPGLDHANPPTHS